MRYHLKQNVFKCLLVCCTLFFILAVGGCTGRSSSGGKKSGPLRDATPEVRVPEAPGTSLYNGDHISLDASHTADGYVMLNYSGSNEKVKLQIKAPDGTEYTYLVSTYGAYAVYPLPGGNGTYNVAVYESASVEDNLYAVVFTQDLDVAITDSFSPFLYPNYYVNFSADSACVKKGSELAADCYSDLDVVSNIYDYVIKNISYDTAKAENVQYGYTPNPDDTLASGTGICFDYASLMSSMLRSQRIPTKLEVGYAGEVYHAWISCYVDEIGWVDDIIEFDGKNWSLMDPTLAANNDSSAVKEYIGDGSKYIIKYTY